MLNLLLWLLGGRGESIRSQNLLELRKSLFSHRWKHQVCSIYMSKVSNRSAKPFEFLTFLHHQNVKLSSNNDQRKVKRENSFWIFMTSPPLSNSIFNHQCFFLVRRLKFRVDFSCILSNDVEPILKMNQCASRFWEIYRNHKDSIFISLFCKRDWNEVC